jgi:iron complex transport system substrate-binding protein
LHRRIGRIDYARVAWMFEVVEDLGRVHPTILATRFRGVCNTDGMDAIDMTATYVPRRVVSLQPSATVILRDLGRLESLVACTRYCAEVCPEIAGLNVTIVADSWAAQSSQITDARPDLVIAAVPYQEKALAEILKSGARFLGLAPKSLADIYADIAMISRVMDAREAGLRTIQSMIGEIDAVRMQTAPLSRPRVFCEEWGKPLIASQPWVAELIEAAGGEFVGAPGAQISLEEMATAVPDVLIAAWCGAGDRVPLEKIIATRGWEKLPAVESGRVYCIRDEYLNTPAPTLVRGLRALAAAIHPERFPLAEGLRSIGSKPVPAAT